MKRQQLEIGLAAPAPSCRGAGTLVRPRRVSRARWWFRQMRRVVDETLEPAPGLRPEQIPLPLVAGR